MQNETIPDGCHACGALPCDWVDNPGWRPMCQAPRDRTYILALLGDIEAEQWAHLSGRQFVIRHEGQTVSDYDLGWALYPGLGGTPDHWFAGWLPLSSAPTVGEGRL